MLTRFALASALLLALSLPLPARPGDPTLADSLDALSAGFELGDGSPQATCWTSHRPDGHAPIGVMGDHLHGAGGWMLSLRAMHMHMDGMRDGQTDLSPAEVFARGYAVSPLEMDMDMLMLGGMFAPSERLTLMLMAPYVSKSMDHRTMGGSEFTTEAQGLGDLTLTSLWLLEREDRHQVHANLGLSLPTGSITERDDTPAASNAKLPYPMQLGTGTFDVLPGLTWLAQYEDWSFGAQGTLRFHLGTNGEGYRHGNRGDASAWVARRLGRDFSASLRLEALHWESFHGADDDLNPAVVPTADPDLRGGDRLDALVGLNWLCGSGALAGNRLALEVGLPVYEDLDGPQLSTQWLATIGWQLAF